MCLNIQGISLFVTHLLGVVDLFTHLSRLIFSAPQFPAVSQIAATLKVSFVVCDGIAGRSHVFGSNPKSAKSRQACMLLASDTGIANACICCPLITEGDR